MNATFLPVGRTITYTIEQKSDVPSSVWHRFIDAVVGIYYRLPDNFRPVNPRRKNARKGAYALFCPGPDSDCGELVFSGQSGEGYRRRIITVSRERTRDVLSVDEIETEHQMSVDLFTRLVMLALHNVCGEHFLVHSTGGACSWALPLALVKKGFPVWKAPDVAAYSSFFQADNARLTEQAIVNNLTLCPGKNFCQEQWEGIAALEFRLYEPVQKPSRQDIARLTDPNVTLVDITLGTSQPQPPVTLRDFDALLYWVSVNMPEYESGVSDQEPVFLSCNYLAVLRDDIRNGWFASYNNNPTYADTFYAELQLVDLWAEHCIRTVDFDHDSVFLFATW
ncbi:hypothetical protein [Klebsiella aerogenes]|uniref:Uncharacterized protein n=1 Tax=Klebsiella aerogenes TaxID=548 RepID=A0AAP9U840_KLEAE|nr:hypothetical protein [Klebsiella aerogenes]QMR42935.1 hypothetical protein HV331_25845 [Klebsiella aerogenes]